jgi:Zn-dependent protease with chaperone function
VKPDLVVVKYGEIGLPRRMMGRLTAEDWKPLLAPAIVYNYVLLRDETRDTTRHLFLPLVPMPFLVTFALIALFRSNLRGPIYIDLLITIISLQLTYSSIVLGLYIRRRWRQFFYIADQRAADKVGKEILLAALAKYGEKISATGYPRKRLHLWPTVSQRIERLQKDLR